MSEHRLPRDPQPLNPEHFQVFEEALGKVVPMRDLTDEQLARHIDMGSAVAKQQMMKVMALLGEAQNTGKAVSCLQYEQDRRKRAGGLLSLNGSRLSS